jgi:hypothetical protein
MDGKKTLLLRRTKWWTRRRRRSHWWWKNNSCSRIWCHLIIQTRSKEDSISHEKTFKTPNNTFLRRFLSWQTPWEQEWQLLIWRKESKKYCQRIRRLCLSTEVRHWRQDEMRDDNPWRREEFQSLDRMSDWTVLSKRRPNEEREEVDGKKKTRSSLRFCSKDMSSLSKMPRFSCNLYFHV